MKLDNVLAVSGHPGLYRLVTTRTNGLIVEDFDSGKRNFISLRKHQFTPLESVGIYTYQDVVKLEDIFLKIKGSGDPVPAPNASPQELHAFLREILPDYDEDRVFLSDIKKLIKWYLFLDQRSLISASDEEE
ncbi:MAG: DUF5606 domain-containing protein [Saprospiraceae bacterium]|nr:DUF5606 domain-containing protein [Saprospiraceae bacterium]